MRSGFVCTCLVVGIVLAVWAVVAQPASAARCDEDCPCNTCDEEERDCAGITSDCECQDNPEWQEDRCDATVAESCETVCSNYTRQQTCDTVDIACDCGHDSCPNSEGETTPCRQEHWCTKHPNKPPAGSGECNDASTPCPCPNGQYTCHEQGGCDDVCVKYAELPCDGDYFAECQCPWLDCSYEDGCDQPVCASKPYKCVEALCGNHEVGQGCASDWCICSPLCENNNSGWGCGGDTRTCNCGGGWCLEPDVGWCTNKKPCKNWAMCPSGGTVNCDEVP